MRVYELIVTDLAAVRDPMRLVRRIRAGMLARLPAGARVGRVALLATPVPAGRVLAVEVALPGVDPDAAAGVVLDAAWATTRGEWIDRSVATAGGDPGWADVEAIAP